MVPESCGHLGNRVGFSVSFHFSLLEIFKRIRQEMQYTFSENVTNGKFDVCELYLRHRIEVIWSARKGFEGWLSFSNEHVDGGRHFPGRIMSLLVLVI